MITVRFYLLFLMITLVEFTEVSERKTFSKRQENYSLKGQSHDVRMRDFQPLSRSCVKLQSRSQSPRSFWSAHDKRDPWGRGW